jgi:hypothetical protein
VVGGGGGGAHDAEDAEVDAALVPAVELAIRLGVPVEYGGDQVLVGGVGETGRGSHTNTVRRKGLRGFSLRRPAAVRAAARSMGYAPVPTGFEYARVYMVVRRGNAWIGVADPRYDGQVRGY